MHYPQHSSPYLDHQTITEAEYRAGPLTPMTFNINYANRGQARPLMDIPVSSPHPARPQPPPAYAYDAYYSAYAPPPPPPHRFRPEPWAGNAYREQGRQGPPQPCPPPPPPRRQTSPEEERYRQQEYEEDARAMQDQDEREKEHRDTHNRAKRR